MAVSRKVERELLREDYLKQIIESFLNKDEQVLRVKSNEIYDGFELAEDYEMKLAEKERKKLEAEKKKAEKIRKDKEVREKKKAIAEKGE